MARRRGRLPVAIWMLAACVTAGASAQTQVSIQRAFPYLSFDTPVFLTHSGDGTDRIFVVEQDGIIKVFPNDSTVTRDAVRVFLDLTASVTRFHNEAGLLGLAFHPDYAHNGYFYVNYTRGDPDRTVVARFRVDPQDAGTADPSSEFVILEVHQPFGNHNAGMMQFGPQDGYLYISLGDGGDRRDGVLHPPDSENHGQNLQTLHAAILRIDVDHPSGGHPYGIPADNPFAGNTEGWREEIWAYGLRNPWRFSIDSLTNQLWAGDVGAKAWEEINLVEKGDNLGWSVMEGTDCFREAGCDTAGMKLPLVQHPHEGTCNSITGGYVYRGQRRPELQGVYLYGDYCHGYIRMVRYEDGEATEPEELLDTNVRIASFGIDEHDELYIVNHNGTIHRFTRHPVTTATGKSPETPRPFVLAQNYPNPFNPRTEIRYVMERSGPVELKIYDLLGRPVRTLVSEPQPAGVYSIDWDGTNEAGEDVVSGIYLYTLKSARLSETRTMVLLR